MRQLRKMRLKVTYSKCMTGLVFVSLITLYFTRRQIIRIPVIETFEQFPSIEIEESSVTVLFWTNYHESDPFTLFDKVSTSNDNDEEDPSYKTLQCPTVQKCKFIKNKSLIDVSDGVIFHGRDLHFISQRHNCTDELPAVHRNTQPWILLHREAPTYTRLDWNLFPNIFNWTMSYRTDSDIYFPYGKVVPVDNKYKHSDSYSSRYNHNASASFTGKAAWTVSHCGAHSKRDKLVDNLSKYIEIHVYGKCGNHTCSFPNKDDGCFQQLEQTYKFYLSFENSLCHEYVTEKFFNALNRSLIPVVYGYGPYEKIAPAGSYINARSFHSIQHLGEYLNYLDQNSNEYEKYFEWKKQFQVKPETDKDAWCDLCQKLHKNRVDKTRSYQWYSDLHLWFNSRVTNSKNRPYLKNLRNELSDRDQIETGNTFNSINSEVCIPPLPELLS